MLQIGRFIINLAALVSVQFFTFSLNADGSQPGEVCKITLSAGDPLTLDETETAVFRQVLEQLRLAEEKAQAARVVAVAPPNLRGLNRS